MPLDTPNSRELARRLIDREPGRQDAKHRGAAAAHAACEQVYRDLSRWVGGAGSAALFTRALLSAQSEHPVLAGMELRPDTEPRLAGVGEAVRIGGSRATAAALEALLAELIELLNRFIGADVVVRLVDRNLPGTAGDGLKREEKEE
jgi:hypothetical protein